MKEKTVFKGKYYSDKYGDLRTIFDKEGCRILFCARDVAKALGYRNPSASVKDICLNYVKEAHITDGGLQIMNFIGWDDIARLAQNSRKDYSDYVRYLICAEIDMYDKFCSGKSKDNFDQRRNQIDPVADVMKNGDNSRFCGHDCMYCDRDLADVCKHYCPGDCSVCRIYDECRFAEGKTCNNYEDTHNPEYQNLVKENQNESPCDEHDISFALDTVVNDLYNIAKYLREKFGADIKFGNIVVCSDNGDKYIISNPKEDVA